MCVDRRQFLRAAGVAIALPHFPSLARAGSGAAAPCRRMVAIDIGLGLHPEHFFPERSGRDYELSPYLRELADLRQQFTVLSGTSHPQVNGGHLAENVFLTAAPNPGSSSFRNSISLDQFAAEQLGAQTRFPYLALSLRGRGLSWSRAGVAIPTDQSPARLYEKLFLEDKPWQRKQVLDRLKNDQSILDAVLGPAQDMERRLGSNDRRKFDQYLTAVRDAERRMTLAELWQNRPKPGVSVKQPVDPKDKLDIIEHGRLMYQMMYLALMTDSTRLITFAKNGFNSVPSIEGITIDYHNLTHHGKDPEKLRQLAIIETMQIRIFGEFLRNLASVKEQDGTLLDHTQVLFGSNLGNASNHDNKNMPILLAGGGYRHGQHIAFDRNDNYPLPNLFVTMLQRLGLEGDAFASSTGTLRGLEAV